MNLAQLRYFQQLADVGNYSRAAEMLCISQSALSHSIKSLEEELDRTLFIRDNRQVSLTEDGAVFKEYVDRGLAAISEGIAEMKSRSGALVGMVKMGAIGPVRSWYLPAAMSAFRAECGSSVAFHVAQGETLPLNEALAQGAYDLVIAGPVSMKGLVCTTLYYQPLVVAVKKDHPLARQTSVHLSDLMGLSVISYRPGIPIGDLLTAFLAPFGAAARSINFMRNYEDEIMLGALAANEADDVVALTALTTNLMPNDKLAILPLDEVGAATFYPVSLTYQSGKFRDPAAQAFINFLLSFDTPDYTRTDYAGPAITLRA